MEKEANRCSNTQEETCCSSTHEETCCCGTKTVHEETCCSTKAHEEVCCSTKAHEETCCCGTKTEKEETCCCGTKTVHEEVCCNTKAHEETCCSSTHEETCCCGGSGEISDKGNSCCSSSGKKLKTRNRLILLAISLVGVVLGYFDWESIGFMPFYYVNPAWIAVIICGVPIYKKAFTMLIKNKKITASLLISVAMTTCIALAIACYFPSVKEVLHANGGHNHSYIFASGEVAFLVSLGGLIEEFTIRKTRSGIENLAKLVPKKATVVTENGYIEKKITEVNVGDVVLCKAGEMVAVDGVIVDGITTIDTSSVTGEYVPKDCEKGDLVFGGTMNIEQSIKIKVTKPTKEMTVAKMAQLVQEANGRKAPIAKVADKWASVIVPSSIVFALLAGVISRFALGVGVIESVIRVCTVLVAFCPCVLAIATPTAVSAGIGNCAKNGILIKSGTAIETFAKVDVVCVDKTGTLTTAEIKIDEVETYDIEKGELLKIVASCERESDHPIAKALVKGCENFYTATEVVSVQGVGIRAKVEGKEIAVSSYSAYLKQNAKLDKAEEFLKEGKTVVVVEIDERVKGIIALSDTIKESAITAIKELTAKNVRVIMLTGDNEQSARSIADKCGIKEVKASLMPEEKLAIIRELKENGKVVAMVGDGINDAPSLAEANVGIAMGALGADIAIDTADMCIMNNDLNKVSHAHHVARRAIATIRINISCAMAINVGATILSIFGLLTPATGALVHNGTSLLGVSHSALLLLVGRKSRKNVA